MTGSQAIKPLSRDDLVASAARLQEEIARLQRQVEQLTSAIAALRQDIEDLRRGGKRQPRQTAAGLSGISEAYRR